MKKIWPTNENCLLWQIQFWFQSIGFPARCCRPPCCCSSPWSQLIQAMKILTHEWELCFLTYSIVLSLPLHIYLTHNWLWRPIRSGPILVFPRIQPFGSDDFSSLGKVYSRQATDSVNCENSSVSFVMKYCPTSTVVKNPASVQILNHTILLWWSFHSFFVFLKQIFFLRKVIGRKYVCLHHTWHEQWVRLSFHNKSPCKIMARVTFFTHFWDCSVDTELMNKNKCGKNSFNRSLISAEVYDKFPPPLLSSVPRDNGLVARKTGVRFNWIWSSSILRLCHSPCGLSL